TPRFASKYIALIVTVLMCNLTVLLIGGQASAQTNQYKRKSPPKPAAPTAPADSKTSAATPGDQKASAPNATQPTAAGGKVDVSDLEKKYSVPKDTEFQVVQNRTYTKAKRFALSASVAQMINDYYSSGYVYDITANYYFSERYGAQLQYMRFDSGNSPTV